MRWRRTPLRSVPRPRAINVGCWITRSQFQYRRAGSVLSGDLSHYHSSKELVNRWRREPFSAFRAGREWNPPPPPTAATPTSSGCYSTPGGPTDTPADLSDRAGNLDLPTEHQPDAGYAGCSDTVVSNLWQRIHNRGWDLLGLYYGSRNITGFWSVLIWPVPPGTPIESAVLSLYHVRNTDAGDDRPQEVNVYRVTSPWTEGTGDNPYPEPGYAPDGATWTLAGPGIPWKTAGGDFDPARQASATAPPFSNPDWVSWDVTGLVGEWMNGGAPNHGLMLRRRRNGEHRFASRNAAVPGQRPRLIIGTMQSLPPPIATTSPCRALSNRSPTWKKPPELLQAGTDSAPKICGALARAGIDVCMNMERTGPRRRNSARNPLGPHTGTSRLVSCRNDLAGGEEAPVFFLEILRR